jgi:hypothetical protein
MYVHIIVISTIPSFILVFAMEEQWDGKHFITFAYYYYTLPVRLYPLLISILPCTISDSNWLSVCQVIRAVLLTEIRIWKEEEEKEAVEGDLS